MSVRSEVLLWAQRVTARGVDTPAHVLLEVSSTASIEEAQEAFHKIARTGHPDLHRASLTSEELELVTTAYARVAGAYQTFRAKSTQTTRLRPLKDDPPPVRGSSSDRLAPVRPGSTSDRPVTRNSEVQRTPTGVSSGRAPTSPGVSRTPTQQRTPTSPDRTPTPERTPPLRSPTTERSPTMPATPSSIASQPGIPGPMNSRALIYYRKAELCLRQGDLKAAVLNMKMAIAGDPQSAFLRTALAEIESELGKK